jgi:membrane protease subunit HflC
LAESYRDAEILRGEGDASAAAIYAAAFSKDQDFFRFWRTLTAYRNSFVGQQDILLLEPDSEFFRYFKKSEPEDMER